MNNLPENENSLLPEVEESTIFSDPVEHKKVKSKSNRNLLFNALVLVVALAFLVGVLYWVKTLIPKKKVKDPLNQIAPIYKSVLVLDKEVESLETVVVKNSNGTFKFLSKDVTIPPEVEGEQPTEDTLWYLDNIDADLTDSSMTHSIATSLTKINALREITTSEELCGFDKPRAVVTLKFTDEEVVVTIGAKSPDNAGSYVKVSKAEDKIYLLDELVAEQYTFAALDLASTAYEAPITLGKKYADYYENDHLVRFDKLTAESVNFSEKMVFIQNDKENLASYIPYYVVKPVERPAENVYNLFALFSTEFPTSGAYSYDVSDKTIKSLGLDSPDFTVSATFGDYTYSYKFKKQKDGGYAYIGNNSKNVKRVTADDFGFLTCDSTFFYSKTVFLTQLSELKNLTLKTADKDYSFDITRNPSGDENNQFIIECNGEPTNASNFQSYYQYLCELQALEFGVEKTNEKPELSMIYNYKKNGAQPTQIDFVKVDSTKYQYSINGVPMGKIGSISYNKILKYLDDILDGKIIVVN